MRLDRYEGKKEGRNSERKEKGREGEGGEGKGKDGSIVRLRSL